MKKLEEGGVLGLYSKDNLDAARLMFYGMYALQHRGQTGCGMTTNNNFDLTEVKGKGTVGTVLESKLDTLVGNIALGHLRYGQSHDGTESMQPLNSNYLKGSLSIALGGTIIDSERHKKELENQGAIFQVGNDAEILAHLIAKERIQTDSVENALMSVLSKIDGAFAGLVMSPSKMMAFRDKNGYRPLSMGIIKNSTVFASEDIAFFAMGAEKLRDVMAGEVVLITKNETKFFNQNSIKTAKTCLYEYLYFARPDSVIDGKSVYTTRLNAGKQLYRACPAKADVVIGVPSAGLHYALGYAKESGIPFGDGLIRNYYLGRTAINDANKEEILNTKLNVMRAAVENLDVVLVDDSMIKGATAKRIIARLRESGAKQVHLRIACPRFASPCPYSPMLESKLYHKSVDQICKDVGADSLGFLPKELLNNIGINADCCKKCFNEDKENSD